jgi:hypothetical protein
MSQSMTAIKTYPGLDNDDFGGMTPVGNTIRDAWAFGLLPEGETCTGWTLNALETLYMSVSQTWENYDYDISKLPEEMRERHERYHKAAIEKALRMGWNPDEQLLPEVPDIITKDED